jgi:hypothetical protein
VRLIGVACFRRKDGQVTRILAVAGGSTGDHDGIDPGDEPAETHDPLQRLRTVADRGVAAAPQLPHAEADFGRDVFRAHPRVTQQAHGPGHGGVGPAAGDERSRHVQRGRQRLIGIKRPRQPPRVARSQVGEVNALIAQFAQWNAERWAARGRPETDTDQDRARHHPDGHRTCVRSGHEGTPALLPDQVGARIG